MPTGSYLEWQIQRCLALLDTAAARRFDREKANQNLSLSTRWNYLQRLVEFTHAAGRLYPSKGLLDLGYDEVSSVLEAMKQGKVSANAAIALINKQAYAGKRKLVEAVASLFS